MKRRDFLKKSVLGGAAAVAAGGLLASCEKKEGGASGPAVSTGSKELRMVTSWPKNFPGLGTAAARVGQRIEAMSGGRYKVKLYAAGELVPGLKCMDAVQEGTADLYHSAEYYYQGKVVGFNFFTSVPFGMTPNERDAWVHHGGGQALWDELSAQFGVKALACSNTGSQMGGWFKNPVRSTEDFKGLKMRMPGLGGEVIKALGGTALTLAGGEIMPALQAGTIDATEWVGPWNDLAFGFYKVVKNYMYPGFHEPSSTLSFGISKKLWDEMSATDQAIFTNAAHAENNYGFAEFNANNTAALETLVTKHGVKVHEFSDDVYRAIGEAARDVLSTASKADPLTGKIYESFMRFRKISSDWSRLSDQAYMAKRSLVKM